MTEKNENPVESQNLVEPVTEGVSRTEAANANDMFTKKQAVLILSGTLVASLVIGLIICTQFIWKSVDERNLEATLDAQIEAVDKSPNDAQSRVDLGFAYQQNGEEKKAMEQYDVAIDIDDNFYPAYLNKAVLLEKQEKYTDALKVATEAEDISPESYEPKLIKGRCMYALEDYDKAKEALAEAQELSPGNVEIIYQAGLVAEAQGDKEAAAKIYEEALSYDPTYEEASKALERVQK